MTTQTEILEFLRQNKGNYYELKDIQRAFKIRNCGKKLKQLVKFGFVKQKNSETNYFTRHYYGVEK